MQFTSIHISVYFSGLVNFSHRCETTLQILSLWLAMPCVFICLLLAGYAAFVHIYSGDWQGFSLLFSGGGDLVLGWGIGMRIKALCGGCGGVYRVWGEVRCIGTKNPQKGGGVMRTFRAFLLSVYWLFPRILCWVQILCSFCLVFLLLLPLFLLP